MQGVGSDGRDRDAGPAQDDDQAGRAVHRPPPRLRHAQAAAEGERHPDRDADGAGLGRRSGFGRGRPPCGGSRPRKPPDPGCCSAPGPELQAAHGPGQVAMWHAASPSIFSVESAATAASCPSPSSTEWRSRHRQADQRHGRTADRRRDRPDLRPRPPRFALPRDLRLPVESISCGGDIGRIAITMSNGPARPRCQSAGRSSSRSRRRPARRHWRGVGEGGRGSVGADPRALA